MLSLSLLVGAALNLVSIVASALTSAESNTPISVGSVLELVLVGLSAVPFSDTALLVSLVG